MADSSVKNLLIHLLENVDVKQLCEPSEQFHTLLYGPRLFELTPSNAGLLILALCANGYLPETVMMYATVGRCPLVSGTVIYLFLTVLDFVFFTFEHGRISEFMQKWQAVHDKQQAEVNLIVICLLIVFC